MAWSPVSGAESYVVWDGTDSHESAEVFVVVNGLTPNTEYAFTVRARVGSATSGPSALVSARTLPAPPAAPTGVTAAAVSDAAIRVYWTAVDGAESYEVSGGGKVYRTTAAAYVVNGLSPATLYAFTVRAGNAAGWGPMSAEAAATTQAAPAVDPAAPAAPTGVTATALSATAIRVAWNAVDGASSYLVAWGDAQPVEVTGTSYTANDLAADTTYVFTVKAGNAAGWGAASTPASAATQEAAPTTPPAAPTGVTATALSSTAITVSWTAVKGASSYQVSWGGAAAAEVTETSHTVNGLAAGTAYTFTVKAGNAVGWSAASTPASAATLAAGSAPALPGVPTGVTAAALSTTSIRVSWTPVDGASKYQVAAGGDAGGDAKTWDTSASAYTVTGLTPNTAYAFTVKAGNSAGWGAASAAVTAKTSLAAPGVPAGVTATTLSDTSIQVSWTAVTGADTYEVAWGTETRQTSYTFLAVTGLAAGTAYTFTVKAGNDAGWSAASAAVTASTEWGAGTEFTGLAAGLARLAEAAEDGGVYTITMTGDETIDPADLYYDEKNVRVTIKGDGSDRTVTLSKNGAAFTVNQGVTLNLADGVVLNGRESNSACLVVVNDGGVFVMDGGTVTGNARSITTANAYDRGSGVYVFTGGVFTMNGGTISGNTIAATRNSNVEVYARGAGVYVYAGGVFTMNGGTISGNTAASGSLAYYSYDQCSYGGGVYVTGDFTMNGGTISGNTASASNTRGSGYAIAYGGGVYATGTFTMNDGTISNNTAIAKNSSSTIVGDGNGGGVYVPSGGTFTMKGGKISGNIAQSSYGGGVYVYGTMTKTGGTIYGLGSSSTLQNTARNDDYGHAVYVYASSSSNIKKRNTTAGETVTLDSAKSGAAGGWE